MAKKKVARKWVPFSDEETERLEGVGCEIDGDEAEVTVGDIFLLVRKIRVGKGLFVYDLSASVAETSKMIYEMGAYSYMSFDSLVEDIEDYENDDKTNKFAGETA